MKIITAVLVLAAGALSAQDRVREFEPFNRFMERTRFASSMDLRSPRSKVRGAAAFNEMHRHLLKTYGGVEVKHSFVREASHFDCVPVNQQPAVREMGLESIAEAPVFLPTVSPLPLMLTRAPKIGDSVKVAMTTELRAELSALSRTPPPATDRIEELKAK